LSDTNAGGRRLDIRGGRRRSVHFTRVAARQAWTRVILFARLEFAAFAVMPESQDENGGIANLVAQLVVAHEDPPDLARGERFQLLADPRVFEQPIGRPGQLLHDPRRRIKGDWAEMLV